MTKGIQFGYRGPKPVRRWAYCISLDLYPAIICRSKCCSLEAFICDGYLTVG
jgi:hypothetical protein